MVRCLEVSTLIFAVLAFILLSISTGTKRWKEDNNIYKGMRTYIGLWEGCIWVSGDSVAGLPEYYECDKDFLRPQLIEPPSWFVCIRVLMLLSCLGTGIGILIFIVAYATDKAKKTGSRYWPSGLVILASGLCAFVGLSIFTMKSQWTVEYAYAADKYYALYWAEAGTESIVNGVFFKIETWLRWSYGIGWGGAALTVLAFISTGLADLTRGVY